jgi:hypothetical protein
MRTTLNIDDDLLKAAKIAAVREGTTLTALVEDAVRRRLTTKSNGKNRVSQRDFVLPAHIDPDDSQAVIEYHKDLLFRDDLRSLLGPPATSRGEPCAGLDFKRTSTLLEAQEGPFARS